MRHTIAHFSLSLLLPPQVICKTGPYANDDHVHNRPIHKTDYPGNQNRLCPDGRLFHIAALPVGAPTSVSYAACMFLYYTSSTGNASIFYQTIKKTHPAFSLRHGCVSYAIYLYLLFQKSFIIAHQHHRFHLLHCLKHNADNNDKACTAKRYAGIEYTAEEIRQNCNDGQTNCTYKYNIIQYLDRKSVV